MKKLSVTKTLLLAVMILSIIGCQNNSCNASPKNTIPGPKTEVKMLKGRPTFYIDGKPFMDPLFSTNLPEQKYFDQMSEGGFKVFNFATNCGKMFYHSLAKPVWIAPDKWDFSEMDERAARVLKADPDALILLRISISAPMWWYEQNPDEVLKFDHGGTSFKKPYNNPNIIDRNGPFDCIASEKWRKDMAYSLVKTIEHVQRSEWGKNVFGYQLSSQATEEWYPFNCAGKQMTGYSDPMKKAFKKWLKEKYKTNKKLQDSWNNTSISFETVQTPTPKERKRTEITFRDPAVEMNVIDFYQFYSEVVAETIDYFAKVAKETTNNRKVIGIFYGYFWEFAGSVEYAHNATRKAMLSEHVDFLMSPPCYFDRMIGTGAELYRRPQLSGTLHGKLWFHDNDIASFKYPEVMREVIESGRDCWITEDKLGWLAKALAVQPTAQQSIWQFQRAAGYVLCEGIYESYLDLHGGYYDDPRLISAMAETAKMLKRSTEYDRSSNAQVLVVSDEASAFYGTHNVGINRLNKSLRDFQLGFVKAGAPFDAVFMPDLPLVNLDQYKMIMFLNTYHISDDMRQFIDQKVKGSDRTLIWCYAPGLFNHNKKSVEAMHKLTGIKIAAFANQDLVRPRTKLADSTKQWMKTLGEEPINEPIGQGGKVCRLFYVDDETAEPMGIFNGGQQVTMAKKDMGSWTSIYLLSSVMPPSFVRCLEKEAGVHIYNHGDDAIQVNKSYISINSAKAGKKTITMPYPCDIYNALTEEKWFEDVTVFDTSLMFGEHQIFRYEAKN